VSIALALLTIFFGVTGLWFARHMQREVRTNSQWPTVPGKLGERGTAPMQTSRSVYPVVKYTYSVGGKDYANDQVYLLQKTGGFESAMRKLVDGLPETMPVHYDPKDPSRSYLLAQPMGTYWILLVFSVVVLVVGILRLLTLLLVGG
jgi:hypothetical protein